MPIKIPEIVQLGTKVNTKLGLPPTTHHPPPPPTIHKLFYMKERSYGSQIRYITLTNINKTIHKVFKPTILWGGVDYPLPTPKG